MFVNPFEKDYKTLVCFNLIKNRPVTVQDITSVTNILGKR